MPSAHIVAIELLLAALLVVAVTVVGLARFLLTPARMDDGRAMARLGRLDPTDLGLAYDALRFDVPDGTTTIPIAAWWIVQPGSDRTAILIHGYGDAKVGALAWAPAWRDAGWNLLLIDLRAHGESGGRHSTAGYFERDDLDAVINQLRAQKKEATRLVALFGTSLGAAAALATAARRDDVAGVVAEGVYDDYRRAIATHAERMRAPLPSLLPIVTRLAERWSGARFGDVRPLDTIGRCRCPIFLIHGDADWLMPDGAADALGAALAKRGNPRDICWRVATAGHILALAAEPEEYVRRIAAFAESL